MKGFTNVSIGTVIATTVGVVLAQSSESGNHASQPSGEAARPVQTPDPPAKDAGKPAREHALLKQLVGEWDMTFKMYTHPDQPPTESRGTDSVRQLGDHWVISEMRTTLMGAPYHGVMSLGFDPAKKQVQGTYIDSFGCMLWVYKGTVNEAGDTLTLETEGQSLERIGATAKYKEVIQITGKDTRTFHSSTQFENGTWVNVVTIEYIRKK
ncbi:MAG: DUF1579 family protein [Phycisphaerae bacterium]|nr:DUF1579 domain-containing protein [Planctomycetia bacterium]MCK6466484.1 DUF1579 domain-containing protein [Phycisphaerae bacterium]MCL4720318.1 DUF1579 family protein [Phycisphaerae bacterium]NUQ10671.1 DUF1579 domain-containing protein [Phycisphaerae bacterium]